ncbi:MAG: hypothetical protein ABJD07_00150 [Gemmatimonadaceae bacterium]
MKRARIPALALVALVALGVRAGAAQQQLDARLDPATRAAVAALVDSARDKGLPAEPLTAKALEGASKGADGARIVVAVRALAARLDAARTALGPAAAQADLVAGAAALQAGVQPVTLAKMRAARPREALAVALVVLADIVARGVPADTASKLILRVANSRAGDDAFDALRRDVARDIVAGAPLVVAAAVRTQGVVGGAAADGPATTGLTSSGRPRSP